MVKFTEYFESMVALKPEWRRAYIDYPRLNELLGAIKRSVCIEMVLSDGSVLVATSVQQLHELMAAGGRPSGNECCVAAEDGERVPAAGEDAAEGCRRDGGSSGGYLAPSLGGDAGGGGGGGASKRSKGAASPQRQQVLQQIATPMDESHGDGSSFRDQMGSINSQGSSRSLRRRPAASGAPRGAPIPIVDDDDTLRSLFTRQTSSGSAPVAAAGSSGILSPADTTPPPLRSPAGRGAPAAAVAPLSPTLEATAASLRSVRIPLLSAPETATEAPQPNSTPTLRACAPSGTGTPSVAVGGMGATATPGLASLDFLPPQVLPITPNTGEDATFAALGSASTNEMFLPSPRRDAAVAAANRGDAGHGGGGGGGGGGDGLLQVSSYHPKMSHVGVSAANEFETVLGKEVEKARQFARSSLETFYRYFEVNQKLWLDKNYSRPRAKDSMRYLHNEVAHLCEFVETNELTVKKALKKYLNAHPFFIREEVSEAHLLPDLKKIGDETEQLREAISAIWAEVIGGDVNDAKKKLVGRSASPSQSFRAGALLSMIVATLLYWAHVFFELQLDESAKKRFEHIFPIVRFFITIAFVYIAWSWTLFHLVKNRINYLYVFELSQKASMTWMQCFEYGLLMFWVAVLFPVLYVRSLNENTDCYDSAHGFPRAAPFFIPLAGAVFILTVAFPIRRVFHRSRRAFFRCLWRNMKQPLGGAPMFQDFFVADWGTSFSIPFMDLLYTMCYYIATPAEQGNFSSPKFDTCDAVRSHWGYPVAMIPFFWRACHTLKMYRKTHQRAHLVNHGKYLAMIAASLVQWAHALAPSSPLLVIVWLLHVGSQLYAYAWDILMDWGWIRGSKRGTLFKSMRPHVAAIVFDFLARMFFIPASTSIQPTIGPAVMYTIQALLEVVRRAVWSVFRLENENLNNLETYRTIDFVPHVVLYDE